MGHERDESPADAPCFQCPTGPGLSHRGLLGASSPEGGLLPWHPPCPLHPGVSLGLCDLEMGQLSLSVYQVTVSFIVKVILLQHKINHLKMSKSVALFSTFTILSNDHLHLVPKHFIPPQEGPQPTCCHFASPSSQPVAAATLLSVLMDPSFPDISLKRNHVTCDHCVWLPSLSITL